MTSAWVAGALVGAVMGLGSQAYWLIVLAYRPPEFLTRGSATPFIGNLVLFGGLLATGGWILIGALLAIVFDAVQSGDPDAVLFPSIGFFFVILFLATFALIPAMVMMRTWLRHVFVTYLLFTGLFGLLLPNLVVAVRN